MLEAAESPTVMMVLPALEELNGKLKIILNGVRLNPDFNTVPTMDESLAFEALNALHRIIYYDMWPAAFMFHPGLRGLLFF